MGAVRGRRWVLIWLLARLLPAQAVPFVRSADTFSLLDPARTYTVRLIDAADGEANTKQLVWVDPATQEVVYEPAFGLPLSSSLCGRTDAMGTPWLATAGPEPRLLRLASPFQAKPIDLSARLWPGTAGAERLRDILRNLSACGTTDGRSLVPSALVTRLYDPVYDTGPGPDVNFPRPAARREAAANDLREVGIKMLNELLTAFAEHSCLYLMRNGQSAVDLSRTRLPAHLRAMLKPLTPFPDTVVDTWRDVLWRKQDLTQRRAINRLLLPYFVPELQENPVLAEVNLGAGALPTFFTLQPDPWDPAHRGQVLSLFGEASADRLRTRYRRLCVVDQEGRILWNSNGGGSDEAWAAIAAAEIVVGCPSLAARDGGQPEFSDLGDGLNPRSGLGTALARVARSSYHAGQGFDQRGFMADGVDLATMSSEELVTAAGPNLVGSFRVEQGAVHILRSGRVVLCPRGGRPTVLRDQERLRDSHGRPAYVAQARGGAEPTEPAAIATLPSAPAFVPSTQRGRSRVDSAELVRIPAGEFLRGRSGFDAAEEPLRRITVGSYWIYLDKVTRAQYSTFCRATGRRIEYAGDPLYTKPTDPAEVTWDLASAYAQWAGGSLPTEAEWEKAARGTDGRPFPWGLGPAPGRAGSPSPYGVTNLVQRASEWCADFFDADYYATSPAADPMGPATGAERSVRGGPREPLVCARHSAGPDGQCSFRVVIRDRGN